MRVFESSAAPLPFPEPLHEGVIVARPNRFIIDVELGGAEADAGAAGGTADGGQTSRGAYRGRTEARPCGDGTDGGGAASGADGGTSKGAGRPSGVVRCHCPAVSRIGGLDLAGRPCLVSDSHNAKRKMPLTVEAFSLQQPGEEPKRWVGINQNASNRYVEHFLREGALEALTGPVGTVRREVPLGKSRLDFLVNDDLYLEVKTPLVQIQTDVPSYVPRLPEAPFSSTERALRHLRELAASLEHSERSASLERCEQPVSPEHRNQAASPNHSGRVASPSPRKRAVVLYCLYYDNFGFRFYHGTTYEEVLACVDACRTAGVELWQADFRITPTAVSLTRYYQLEEW